MPMAKVGRAEIVALAKRATRARVTIPELLDAAGIGRVTWWRWEKAGAAPVANFRKLEAKLAELEAADNG